MAARTSAPAPHSKSVLGLLLPCLSLLSLGAVPGTAAAAPPTPSTATVETRFVEVGGVSIAYRILGPDRAPALLLLNRFRGTMDHWDPLLIDKLATRRRVVMFDQPGFARSGGAPADSLSAYAASAVQVLKTLGIERFDVLGFSMGGTVALQLLLDHPHSVERAVIAGSAPGFVPGDVPSNKPAGPEVWQVATKPANNDADFLYLFFEPSESSQRAGQAYLSRLGLRKDAFVKQVEPATWQLQLKSAMAVGQPDTSLLPRLRGIQQPVLVANGRHDIMAPTYSSYAMAQELPCGTLKIYPDSGHGFLFQYAEDFADEVLRFLE